MRHHRFDGVELPSHPHNPIVSTRVVYPSTRNQVSVAHFKRTVADSRFGCFPVISSAYLFRCGKCDSIQSNMKETDQHILVGMCASHSAGVRAWSYAISIMVGRACPLDLLMLDRSLRCFRCTQIRDDGRSHRASKHRTVERVQALRAL